MSLKQTRLSISFMLTLLLFEGFLAQGCSTALTNRKVSGADSTLAGIALSQEEAAVRSKQVSQVSYTLWFDLNSPSDEFEATAAIQFDLKAKARDFSDQIFLEFEEGSIHSINLNGTPLTDIDQKERYDGRRLHFKIKELSQAANRLEIAYSHPYSKDGNGLYKYKDPADAKIYLFTHFEPYNAHRVFPCFDQPDLKATYQLKVTAPVDWEVISNTLPTSVVSQKTNKSWAFPPSAKFSTYLFALHAGPYSTWHDQANDIPLRLFARKSLEKYVDQAEWFEITKQGLDFYNVQFGLNYPFKKYDQVIVPDFNPSAMENVGAVTFAEHFIFRTPVTQDRRLTRANVILHEMAHMWFGDLVTMRWWNGLWLNESFATFMASLAVDKATRFKSSWQDFFSHEKQWAYWEDQLVTTHPIELPVFDTEHAKANFDGITYGKGASVLKQLSFFLGEDDFREGLQRYFQKYAYRNTTLREFIRMLAEASNKNLNTWQTSWLQTSGLNTLKVDWACEVDKETEKSKISRFNVIQKDAFSLRPHRTQVGIFQFKSPSEKEHSQLVRTQTFDVSYSMSETKVLEAIGLPCPSFVFPNDQDYDYAKLELDPESLEIAKNHLSQFEDPFTKQMIWHTLWEMVIDGKVKAQDYAQTVFSHAKHEKDTKILSKILRTLSTPSYYGSSVEKFLTGEERTNFQNKLAVFVHHHLTSAQGGSDLQLVWYQAYLASASSKQASRYARQLLEGKEKLHDFKIDQDRRWDLIQVLARNGADDATVLIEAEKKKDQTELGMKAAIGAEVSIPHAETKTKWLSLILKEASAEKSDEKDKASSESYSFAQIRKAMVTYQLLNQEDLLSDSIDSYFENLPKIAMSRSKENEEFIEWYSVIMFPMRCDEKIVQRTSQLLEQFPDLPETAVKALKKNRQEEERCIRARKLAAGSSEEKKELKVEFAEPKTESSPETSKTQVIDSKPKSGKTED